MGLESNARRMAVAWRMAELAAHLVDGVLGVFVRTLLGFEQGSGAGAGAARSRRGGDGDSALRVGVEHQRPFPHSDW
jgi:hypothetical protein